MALLDSANTCGLYSERIQLIGASGFEKGKTDNIYVEARVSSVTDAIALGPFQIEADVSVNSIESGGAAGLYTVRKNVAGQSVPIIPLRLDSEFTENRCVGHLPQRRTQPRALVGILHI